jgi:hypothetical protein
MRARPVLALALAALVAGAPAAWADGDPASDVLLSDDVFFPYAPPTARPLSRALVGVLQAAKDAGYPMKVALIESPGDLGAYPQMFNQPQSYANLLAGELPGNPHGGTRVRPHLLVVMPGGFGGDQLGARVDEALAPVTIAAAAQSDGLARAAIHAVARLATANGHPVAVPREAATPLAVRHASTKRKTGTSAVVFVAPVLLVLLGAGLAGRIASRRAAAAEEQ